MYEDLIKNLRDCANSSCEHCAYLKQDENCFVKFCGVLQDAADAIEIMNRRIERAIELYNRNVEKSAMYEALAGISPEPPKEETT